MKTQSNFKWPMMSYQCYRVRVNSNNMHCVVRGNLIPMWRWFVLECVSACFRTCGNWKKQQIFWCLKDIDTVVCIHAENPFCCVMTWRLVWNWMLKNVIDWLIGNNSVKELIWLQLLKSEDLPFFLCFISSLIIFGSC